MKNRMFMLIISAVMLLSVPAFSQMRGGMGDGPDDCRMMPGGPFFGDPVVMQEKIGLSDEQAGTISKINTEFAKKHLDIKEKLSPLKIRLKKLMLEESVDLKAVRAVIEEISKYQVDLQMLKITHRLEIEKVLTAEQKIKLRSERHRMMKEMHDGMGPGMKPGMGPGPEGGMHHGPGMGPGMDD